MSTYRGDGLSLYDMLSMNNHQYHMNRFGSYFFLIAHDIRAVLAMIVLCLILCSPLQGNAQSLLSASSATADVNSTVAVTITGTVTQTDAPIIVVLEFDRTLLDPRSVEAGTIMTDGITSQFTPIVGSKRGRLEITAQSIAVAENASICTVKFLVLAGDSSHASVMPLSLIQNGAPLSVTIQSGTVTIAGTQVSKVAASTLGTPYPHPVSVSCRVPYTLGEDTPVQFSLFTIYGQLVEDYPEIQGKTGRSFFEFKPEINLFGSCPYILRMTTRSSSHNTLLLLNKQ